MLNLIILIGRLTADPELRYTPNGNPVCTFTLAVERQKHGDREQETDFINIVAWRKLGELCAQYLKKGRIAAVKGRLQIRSYENNEGRKIRVAEVVADEVRFLDRGHDHDFYQRSGDERQDQPSWTSAYGSPKDDPFIDDGKQIDISDDDLPF